MVWEKSWPTHELQQSRQWLIEQRRHLSSLPDYRDSALGDDARDKLNYYLARYLSLRATGHIELVVETVIREYARAQASTQVANYIEKGLFKGRNVKAETLISRLGAFDGSLKSKIEEFLEGGEPSRKSGLNAMVKSRNNIAHGQSDRMGVKKALENCDLSLELTDFLIELFGSKIRGSS